MKQFLIIAAVVGLISEQVIAMNCAACPACPGSGHSSGSLLTPGTLSLNNLFIPNSDEETGIINLQAGITSWMEGGIGFGLKREKAVWSLRIQVVDEMDSGWRPAMLIGLGSVQTGKNDQSLYLQAAKTFTLNEKLSLRLSAGTTSLFKDFENISGLAGATISFQEKWSSFINYDGESIHPGISWNPKEWLTVAGIMIEAETPAILAGFLYTYQKK